MLASLTVDSMNSSARTATDLVCVIDHSGSMQGEKMELVRNTFKYLLEYLDDADRLSIVIFDDTVSRLIPLMRTTEENKKKILTVAQTITANGGTDIALGMEHAFQILKDRKQANPVTSIFLLSDGLDGDAQNSVKQKLEAYKVSDNITINTFGFGSDHDPKLMTDIASLRDGSFYFINQLDQIDEAFVDCLGGLVTSVAQSAVIKVIPEQSASLTGVQITKAYGDASMWTHENGTYTTKLANIISGRQKDFVLELQIPKNTRELLDHQKTVCVAKAEAVLVGLDGQQVVKQAELRITLLNEVEELKDQEEDDREVMKNFYRVKGALLIGEARKLADQNKNDDAKKLLKDFKEELGNSFLKAEEFIKNLITDIATAMKDVNPVVYQQVGRSAMMSNERAQMYQKSNIISPNCYTNERQNVFNSKLRMMKE